MDRFPDLTCPICHDLFENVVSTPCCSTGYCCGCLDDALKSTNGTCPHCRQPLSIFQCSPNKMVQRMVDNLPAECTYCSASLTRSIVEEHLAKCENRPAKPGDHHGACVTHGLPLDALCAQDGRPVCSLCTLVGAHRHHTQPKAVFSSSEVAPKTRKEVEVEMLTYASLILLDCGVPFTAASIRAVLDAANCRLEDDSVVDLFVGNAHRFDEWMESGMHHNAPPPQSLAEAPIQFDEKAASAEYEALKEKYHNEQFNFEGLQMRAVPISHHLLPKVKNHLYVLMEIRVGTKKQEARQKRPPFSLSLVLDRSGSMAGGKLTRSIAAIKDVIENLEQGDVLHLVQYDNSASVVFRDGNVHQKREMLALVDSVYATGCTNLSDGTDLGFRLLKEQKVANEIQRMFLFSDGCANGGITSFEGVTELIGSYHKAGVNTSAFGIGDDFDERMMKGISESGHGHYFFIDSSGQIPAMLAKAFGGLERVVATNAVLKMKGSKGRVVKKLSGNEDLFKGIPLGDLRERDLKQVLVAIEIEEDASENPIEVLEFELSYERKDEFIPEGPQRGNLLVTTTTDRSLLSKLEDEVVVNLSINECGDLDKTVVKLMEQNKLDEALKIKRQVVRILSDIAPKDKVGFAKVLLLRAHNRLHDLEQLKSRNSSKSFASVKKAIHEEASLQSDEDMGFGLFD